MQTPQEKWKARRKTLRKFRISEKNKIIQKRYRKKHREQLNKLALAWVNKNREHVRKLEKKRNATPKGKAIRKAIQLRYNKKNHIKRLAKDAINNAIKAGKLIRRSCIFCNSIGEGHHPNYTKPLLVIWLCKKHHLSIHKLMKNLKK